MAGTIGLTQDPVHSLSGVQDAIGKIDAFFGLLLSVPSGAEALPTLTWIPDGGTWYEAHEMSVGWYYTDPAISWRSRGLDGMFQAFDPADAMPNFIEKLGVLKGMQQAIGVAGGTASQAETAAIAQTLSEVGQWLGDKSAAFSQSLASLTKSIGGVQWLIDQLQRDMAIFSEDTAATLRALNQRVIDCAKGVQPPDDAMLTAWTSMQTLIQGLSQRVSAAGARDIGSVLQQLDIDVALKEWPILAALAQSYRPGPLPPVPPPPAGVG